MRCEHTKYYQLSKYVISIEYENSFVLQKERYDKLANEYYHNRLVFQPIVFKYLIITKIDNLS